MSATVSVTAGIVLFVALGGVGFAQSTIALEQDEQEQGGQQDGQSLEVQVLDGKKVTVCHKARRAISISVNALPAHLLHGDSEGGCIAAASTDATDETTAKKPKKTTTAETDELAVTGKAKKQKKTKAASSGELGSTSAVSPKPKKQKPSKAKGGHVSPPGLLGAAPPGHVKQAAQGKGNGSGKNK